MLHLNITFYLTPFCRLNPVDTMVPVSASITSLLEYSWSCWPGFGHHHSPPCQGLWFPPMVCPPSSLAHTFPGIQHTAELRHYYKHKTALRALTKNTSYSSTSQTPRDYHTAQSITIKCSLNIELSCLFVCVVRNGLEKGDSLPSSGSPGRNITV